MIVSTVQEIKKLIQDVEANIGKTRTKVMNTISEYEPKEAFAKLKFDKIASDPLSGESINFIEMLNQAYSDFVVLMAVEDLLKKYPEKSFELHTGALAGYDIISTDRTVAVECFATVSAFNNQKIKKDSEKLLLLGDDIDKYVYFYSKEDLQDKINTFKEKYENIEYIRIEAF